MKWQRYAAWAGLVVMAVAIGLRIAYNDQSYLNIAFGVLVPIIVLGAILTQRELNRRGMTWRDLWD